VGDELMLMTDGGAHMQGKDCMRLLSWLWGLKELVGNGEVLRAKKGRVEPTSQLFFHSN
jgi:hypothetical protein